MLGRYKLFPYLLFILYFCLRKKISQYIFLVQKGKHFDRKWLFYDNLYNMLKLVRIHHILLTKY
jgi:hypothetical protein